MRRRTQLGLVAVVALTRVNAPGARAQNLRESTWEQAAAQLKFPVYEPQETLGLALSRIETGSCEQDNKTPHFVGAAYGDLTSKKGPILGITEGYPEICGNDGEAVFLRSPVIDGVKASVGVVCVKSCRVKLKDGVKNGYQLFMHKRGAKRTMFQIDARGISYKALLKLARSLKRVTYDPAKLYVPSFQSPDRKTWCWISDSGTEEPNAFCGRDEPNLAGTVKRDGTVTLCVEPTYGCTPNWLPHAPVLGVGQQNDFDGFVCTSDAVGIRCTVSDGPGAGKGFQITSTGVTQIP